MKVCEWGVEENVSVGGVLLEDGGEGCGACGYDGERSGDEGGAVVVGEVAFFSERLEVCGDGSFLSVEPEIGL